MPLEIRYALVAACLLALGAASCGANDQAVGTDLEASSSAEIKGEIQCGLDFARQVDGSKTPERW